MPNVTLCRKRSDCAATARFCHSVRFGVNSASLCISLMPLPCTFSLTPRCTSSPTHLPSPLFFFFHSVQPFTLSVTSWNRKVAIRFLSKDPTCTIVVLIFHTSKDYFYFPMCTCLISSSLTAITGTQFCWGFLFWEASVVNSLKQFCLQIIFFASECWLVVVIFSSTSKVKKKN